MEVVPVIARVDDPLAFKGRPPAAPPPPMPPPINFLGVSAGEVKEAVASQAETADVPDWTFPFISFGVDWTGDPASSSIRVGANATTAAIAFMVSSCVMRCTQITVMLTKQSCGQNTNENKPRAQDVLRACDSGNTNNMLPPLLSQNCPSPVPP